MAQSAAAQNRIAKTASSGSATHGMQSTNDMMFSCAMGSAKFPFPYRKNREIAVWSFWRERWRAVWKLIYLLGCLSEEQFSIGCTVKHLSEPILFSVSDVRVFRSRTATSGTRVCIEVRSSWRLWFVSNAKQKLWKASGQNWHATEHRMSSWFSAQITSIIQLRLSDRIVPWASNLVRLLMHSILLRFTSGAKKYTTQAVDH